MSRCPRHPRTIQVALARKPTLQCPERWATGAWCTSADDSGCRCPQRRSRSSRHRPAQRDVKHLCRRHRRQRDLAVHFHRPPAGDHVITVRCVNQNCGQTTGTVWVGYKDLRPLPPSPNYVLVGATSTHSNNHYLTDAAITKLNELVASYRVKFPNDPLLHLNDASLERGGVFDIKTQTPWTHPHREHRRGTVIDIRANDAPGAIPLTNHEIFIELANRMGANARLHSSGTSNQHFHVRLMGVGE